MEDRIGKPFSRDAAIVPSVGKKASQATSFSTLKSMLRERRNYGGGGGGEGTCVRKSRLSHPVARLRPAEVIMTGRRSCKAESPSLPTRALSPQTSQHGSSSPPRFVSDHIRRKRQSPPLAALGDPKRRSRLPVRALGCGGGGGGDTGLGRARINLCRTPCSALPIAQPSSRLFLRA